MPMSHDQEDHGYIFVGYFKGNLRDIVQPITSEEYPTPLDAIAGAKAWVAKNPEDRVAIVYQPEVVVEYSVTTERLEENPEDVWSEDDV